MKTDYSLCPQKSLWWGLFQIFGLLIPLRLDKRKWLYRWLVFLTLFRKAVNINDRWPSAVRVKIILADFWHSLYFGHDSTDSIWHYILTKQIATGLKRKLISYITLQTVNEYLVTFNCIKENDCVVHSLSINIAKHNTIKLCQSIKTNEWKTLYKNTFNLTFPIIFAI